MVCECLCAVTLLGTLLTNLFSKHTALDRLSLDQLIVIRLVAQLVDEFGSDGPVAKHMFRNACWQRSTHARLRKILEQLFILKDQGLYEQPHIFNF
jgi:hypothetical protein